MTWLNKIKFSGTNLAKEKSLVGVSFDDGPDKNYTLEVLKILKKFRTRATFFWIVENAIQLNNNEPGIFAKIVSEIKGGGHEIGLHAPRDYKPTIFYRIFGRFTKQEIEKAKNEIKELTGLSVRLFRPHYLQLGRSVAYADELELITVLGDFIHYTTADVEKDVQIKKFSKVKPGNILVFHDGISIKTPKNRIVEVLPTVIENLNKQGIRGVSISEILELKEFAAKEQNQL